MKGRFNKIDAVIVNKEANIRGANIKTSSRMLLVEMMTSITINISVIMMALTKELITVLPASNIITGVPVAFGAMLRTALTNAYKFSFSRMFLLGIMSTVAIPLLETCRENNDVGISFRLIFWASNEALNFNSWLGRLPSKRRSRSSNI